MLLLLAAARRRKQNAVLLGVHNVLSHVFMAGASTLALLWHLSGLPCMHSVIDISQVQRFLLSLLDCRFSSLWPSVNM
jgi:hypothetical protein